MEHTARLAADGLVVPAAQTYYTVAEIAEMWKVSKDHARRIFDQEPGVLVFSAPAKKYKRGYRTLRIPASVLDRVIRRMTQAE